MRSHTRYRVDQPPGASRPSNSPFLSQNLELLWNAADAKRDAASGQIGFFFSRTNTSLETHQISGSPAIGVNFGDATTNAVYWPSRSTAAQTKWTYSCAFYARAGSNTQFLVWNSGTAGGGMLLYLASTGDSLVLSKSGVADFGTTAITVNTPYWVRASHDEATDEFWLIATSLLDGSSVVTTGTQTSVAIGGDGTAAIGGRTDGGLRSSNSPIFCASIDFEFMPIALGYAWQNPWEMFEPIDVLQAASVGNSVFVPMIGRGPGMALAGSGGLAWRRAA